MYVSIILNSTCVKTDKYGGNRKKGHCPKRNPEGFMCLNTINLDRLRLNVKYTRGPRGSVYALLVYIATCLFSDCKIQSYLP